MKNIDLNQIESNQVILFALRRFKGTNTLIHGKHCKDGTGMCRRFVFLNRIIEAAILSHIFIFIFIFLPEIRLSFGFYWRILVGSIAGI